ncbi:MAG: TIGR02391 family protein [Sideroxyarcus sp.]
MPNEISNALLKKIFVGNASSSTGLDAKRFRADHHEHLDQIDSLVSARYIEDRDGKYSLRLETLPEIADDTPQIIYLFGLCEELFAALRQAYLKNPGENVLLDDLAKFTKLQRDQICTCVPYLNQASVIGGYSNDLSTSTSYVTPSEKLLRHKSFSQVVDEIRSWTFKPPARNSLPPLTTAFPIFGNDLTFEHLLHPIIVQHALAKYRDGHLRNAVLDSIIAIFDLIRQKTGLSEDGDELIGKAFSLATPHLVLSEIESESGKNEQKGFIQILKGAYQGIRNPNAHSLNHDLTQVEAAQYLVLASLLTRRIEEAEVVSR